ncbi:ribosomal protein S18-alanine N-acetyltransferase [Staphylococcus simiae]|uniref:[Ribosomal protein bS18]-alanine N-acetyltransferase n=1 Tax=Staphylococcus simiae CCM 7213 = CCUG 51256 TaxID=911238 RepID=G5JKS4_9STAP|nr:ribosomal protein S18-alanine N-acetyltransferase [Staphylococcus simiae]EHJ07203.1 ribosomal-protein-alanine acetyltransferase [Staphylococcus simiae CCM 7213 = CCUG 51256]PNZ14632.1 ribosomal-protein-alanine N-acetyltransferase [Staphylococcus simiae]SNV76583.1 Ribosomal-protein-S18p-alanine acetyltransferase [Staphylococcus simiae]
MDQQAKAQLNIRVMSKDDVPQVFDIERHSFNDSSWTVDAFYHEIEQNTFAKYFVIEYQSQIIGYLGLWIVIDQAQITTVAIDHRYRGFGLGQMLLEYGKNYASHTCDVMSLEVRVDNYVAQHVYENLGFQYGGKRKNYYGEGEDAMVMWVNLHDK